MLSFHGVLIRYIWLYAYTYKYTPPQLANMYLEQGLLEKVSCKVVANKHVPTIIMCVQAEVTFKEAMRFMLAAGMKQVCIETSVEIR